MPNWVSINMTVESKTPEEMKQFREEIAFDLKNEVQVVSFRKIIPMPAVLDRTGKGSISSIAWDAFYGDPTIVLGYSWVKDAGVKDVEGLREFLNKEGVHYRVTADRAKKAKDETGYTNWYDWSVDNWGTKWDACSIDEVSSEDNLFEIRFDTAWSLPVPVLKALAQKYPHLGISGAFTEEDNQFEGEFDSDFDSSEMEIDIRDVPDDELNNDDNTEAPDLGEVKLNSWF